MPEEMMADGSPKFHIACQEIRKDQGKDHSRRDELV